MQESTPKYIDKDVDLREEGDSRTQQVLMVGENKKVLEVGPASGYVTRALRERGCHVTCIEIETKAARVASKFSNKMICGNIETLDLGKVLRREKFDVILFGDVLEHLKDPGAVLRRLRPHLKSSGHVVATVPNIAHGSIRLLLLDGIFDSQRTGIMDSTHLHFYTRKTICELFRESGYRVQQIKEIKVPISAAENLKIDLGKYPQELVEALESDSEATVHQFALTAIPARMSTRARIVSEHRTLVTRELRSKMSRRLLSDPLSMLLGLYSAREDLQKAFPEVRKGDYGRLIDWVSNVIKNRTDAYRLFLRHAPWYDDNPISSEPQLERLREELLSRIANLEAHSITLENELVSQRKRATNLENELQARLKAAVSERDSLSTELRSIRDREASLENEVARTREHAANLENELVSQRKHATNLQSQLALSLEDGLERRKELEAAIAERELINTSLKERDSRIRELEAERHSVRTNLIYARLELDGIKSGLGFKIIRFYGGIIDRALPDGTRRGEFKNIVKVSLSIASSQGIATMASLAFEKLKRREFRLTRNYARLADRQTGSSELVATRMEGHQTRLTVESPLLSSTKPTLVSRTAMVSGWVVSDKPIDEVRVYLDDEFLGLAYYGLPRPDVGLAFPTYPDALHSGFQKLIILDERVRGQHKLRITVQTRDAILCEADGVVSFEDSPLGEFVQFPLHETQHTQNLNTRVSVIILTKTPPSDFDYSLERIRNQIGVSEIEIVIISSGPNDLSYYAKKYGAKIITISPSEFNHAATRTFAAENATGEYIAFLVDDAIPAGNDLLATMVQTLADEDVGAVTVRQIPRSDSDLLYCQSMWWHYRMLGFNHDRIVGSERIDELAPEKKRAICQIDDVCSCFRRQTFLKYKYAGGYAEDLELGIRLARGGYKIAQLYSVGVIHSHNRPPSYHLRRSYVDFMALSRLLNYKVLNFVAWSVSSEKDLFDLILRTYSSLNFAVDELRASQFHGYDIQECFKTLRDQLQVHMVARKTRSQNNDLDNILHRIGEMIGYDGTESKEFSQNPVTEGYVGSLGVFQEWLINTHKSIENLEEEFVDTLYKLFAIQVGHQLAQFASHTESKHREDDQNSLGRFLSQGI